MIARCSLLAIIFLNYNKNRNDNNNGTGGK